MPVTASRWPITNGSTSQNVFRCDMVLEMSRVAPKQRGPIFASNVMRMETGRRNQNIERRRYEKQAACLWIEWKLRGEKDKWQRDGLRRSEGQRWGAFREPHSLQVSENKNTKLTGFKACEGQHSAWFWSLSYLEAEKRQVLEHGSWHWSGQNCETSPLNRKNTWLWKRNMSVPLSIISHRVMGDTLKIKLIPIQWAFWRSGVFF